MRTAKIVTDPYKSLQLIYAQGDTGKVNDSGGQLKEMIAITADLLVAYPNLHAYLLQLGVRRKSRNISKLYTHVKKKK